MKKFFTFLAAALLSAGLFAESTVTINKSADVQLSFAQDTVSLSFDNGLITTSAEDKTILVTAIDNNTHKYSVALGIQTENIIGEYTEVNLIPESSIIMKENAELVHFRTAQIKIVAGNGDGDYRVDAELLGDDGVAYKVVIYVPLVQATVTKSFDNGSIITSAEDKTILVTAIDNNTHKYSVALGIQSENIVGEYTEKDLIYASSVIMKENGELVHILGAHIKIVAGNGNGDYQVEAELLGDDFVLYDLSIYVKAVQAIVTKSFDNGSIITSAEDEAILVSAVDTETHKYSVALGIQSKEIVGEYTEKDLIYTSSVIMKENGELVHILGAHIKIVAGNGNGDYKVEAELLGDDFVLYDLSIYVKAVQAIVTKSFDNGSITTSDEDQVFVSAVDSVNHKLSIVLGINSKEIVGEFTEKDLIAEVSVIMKENAEFVHILGAHIKIVAGNGNGDYQVEAELLGDDFVLYDLSIYVPAQSEGVENVQGSKVQSTKVIRDGQLLIEKNGVLYNAQGAVIK